MRRPWVAGALAVGLLLTASACSVIAEPNKVGLYYLEGESDGYAFGHCIKPGGSDDGLWNNSVVWLPNDLRTWNIAPGSPDSERPITVAAKPEPSQPSGVQVNVWPQFSLMLNTNCDGGKDSPIVRWWERIGRRYGADTDAGWRTMLLSTVVPALEKVTRVVVRDYSADPLVAGTNHTQVQESIAREFAIELRRVTGGDFFCGPTFDRGKPECPPAQVLVKDVDYADAGIQQARNDKAKALEQAAARLAAAQGEVDAAAKQRQLYDNPAWVALEKAKIQLEIAKACGQNPNCRMIMGADGTIISTG